MRSCVAAINNPGARRGPTGYYGRRGRDTGIRDGWKIAKRQFQLGGCSKLLPEGKKLEI